MCAKVAETPMMAQYYRIKKQHPDAILLFRVGDFYETFCEDAVEVSSLLGITLTKRANGAASHIDLAGFPYHALDTYLPKLVGFGKRVAICDQIEDPKTTKKLVKRAVTELVTPGLTMNDTVLQAKANNFLAAVVFMGNQIGLAFLDLSTGEFLAAQTFTPDADKLLTNFSPKEVLVKRGFEQQFREQFGDQYNLYPIEDFVFTEMYGRDKLKKQFGVQNLKGFGIEEDRLAIVASGAILYYLHATCHEQLGHITGIRKMEEDHYVRLDRFTLRNLEILKPLTDDGVALVDILDKTLTPMGGRLLKRWLVFPLLHIKEIEERQQLVKMFLNQDEIEEEVQERLGSMGDLERLASKIAVGRINPRELLQLGEALKEIVPIRSALIRSGDKATLHLAEKLQDVTSLWKLIEDTIDPEAPALLNRGGKVIRDGVHEELDSLRAIAGGGKKYLLELRDREAQKTGIPSLKVAFNNVFGYYIEVRNTYKDRVPEDWIRKQTLVSAERYITQELKEYEQKILGAEEKMAILETELYNNLVLKLSEQIRKIQNNAAIISAIDVLQSFAVVAQEYEYSCPTIDDGYKIDIKEGRHPVIERLLPVGESYISNDLMLDTETQQIIIVTGPNMSGKSALLRQTAIICLLAQVGSFIPAKAATIGLIDRIFTRVGASDNISRGESTFMVEMTESAAILNSLTARSLVLIDELGRGTSTYDGISIARAIVEYIHEYPHGKAKTLFATHYHELNELEGLYPRIKNFNVSVKEVDGKVLFLRKLRPGGSSHSFGINVAKMAGMPSTIVRRADEILQSLEESAAATREGLQVSHFKGKATPEEQPSEEREEGPYQISFFQLDDPVLGQVRDEIVEVDINRLTPLEALNKLHEIKKLITGKQIDDEDYLGKR